MNEQPERDPRQVLGVLKSADLDDIRKRYLQLVAENPPEKDADRFREIQTAWEQLNNPLQVARQLLEIEDQELGYPELNDVIDAHRKRRPSLPVHFLLSLGNR